MPRYNYFPNPSWEAGTTRWTYQGSGGGVLTETPFIEAAGATAQGALAPISGARYCVFRRTTAGRLDMIGPYIGVTAGTSYAASIYTNRDGTGSGTLDIDWYTGAGTGYISSSTGTINAADGAWGRISIVGTAPANAAYGRVWLHYDAMQANAYLRVDAALFEISATVGTYFDGTFDGGSWVGTANDSTSVLADPIAFNTLTDTFPGTTLSSEWTVVGASNQNRKLAVNVNGAAGAPAYASARTRPVYRLASSSLYFRAQMPSAVGDAANAQMWIMDSNPADTVARLGFEYKAATNQLDCIGQSGASYAVIGTTTTLTYDSTAHKYLAISTSGGSILWMTSPTGVAGSWTTRRTLASPPSWTQKQTLRASFEGFRTSGTNSALLIDAINGSAVTVDARSGIGVAALTSSTRGAGTKTTSSVGRSGISVGTRGSGKKATQGIGRATALITGARGNGRKQAKGLGRAPSIGLRAWGKPPPPVPQFTGRPLPEDPLPLADVRYLVQNILTGDWLHTDLPLSEDQVTITLSGPCEISGKIVPEMADLKTTDGKPLLRSWGHILYLEMDGEIRAAGLITEDSYDDQTQSLMCKGVSAYPSTISYQGNYRRYFADPIDVIQQMWSYVQGFANGNLGVGVERMGGRPQQLYGAGVNLVPGDNLLGVKIAPTDSNNTSDDQPVIPVRQSNTIGAVFRNLQTQGFKNRALIDSTKPASEAGNVPPSDTIFVNKAGLKQAYLDYFLSNANTTGFTLANPPDQTSSVTIEPFKFDWWDVKSCGDVINDAAKYVPCDYVEQYKWNYPHTFVDQSVLLAHPRLGRRRDDLRFVQGENIVSSPGLESDPDSYATCVIGIGAGEGSESLRESAEAIVPGRIRKTYVYRNANITDRAELRRIVQNLLIAKQLGGHAVSSVIVQASHVNAKFGAYNVGDDILVQVLVPQFGWITQWGRITSMTLAREDDLVQINLKRSDSFLYGREAETS